MSHAAGKLADRLHLLRLPQLLFEALLLRDVLDHARDHVAVSPGTGWALTCTSSD